MAKETNKRQLINFKFPRNVAGRKRNFTSFTLRPCLHPDLSGLRQKYFEGFNNKVIATYARGMSVRDIQSWELFY